MLQTLLSLALTLLVVFGLALSSTHRLAAHAVATTSFQSADMHSSPTGHHGHSHDKVVDTDDPDSGSRPFHGHASVDLVHETAAPPKPTVLDWPDARCLVQLTESNVFDQNLSDRLDRPPRSTSAA
jgi:hypothetical protein